MTIVFSAEFAGSTADRDWQSACREFPQIRKNGPETDRSADSVEVAGLSRLWEDKPLQSLHLVVWTRAVRTGGRSFATDGSRTGVEQPA